MLPEESLQDIAIKYGVTLSDLITLNQFSKEWLPKPGSIIRIKELEIIKP
jgi:LysM repeat protein